MKYIGILFVHFFLWIRKNFLCQHDVEVYPSKFRVSASCWSWHKDHNCDNT